MFGTYDNDEQIDPMFSINLAVRDQNGNPTGQVKEFGTDDPYKLWVFFNRFQGKPKRKKKKVKKNANNEE